MSDSPLQREVHEEEDGYVSNEMEEDEEEREGRYSESTRYDEETESTERHSSARKKQRRRSRTRSRSRSPRFSRERRRSYSLQNCIEDSEASNFRKDKDSAGYSESSKKRRPSIARRSSRDSSSSSRNVASNTKYSPLKKTTFEESRYGPKKSTRDEGVSYTRGRSGLTGSVSSRGGSYPTGGSSFSVWGDGQEGTIPHRRRLRQRNGGAAACSYCGDELEHAVAVNIYVPGETRVGGEWKPNAPSARRNHRKFFLCVHFLADLVCNTRETEGSRLFVRTAGPKFVQYSPCGPRQTQYARKFIDCIRNGESVGR